MFRGGVRSVCSTAASVVPVLAQPAERNAPKRALATARFMWPRSIDTLGINYSLATPNAVRLALSKGSYEDAIALMTRRARVGRSRGAAGPVKLPSKWAIFQARDRLGAEPLKGQ